MFPYEEDRPSGICRHTPLFLDNLLQPSVHIDECRDKEQIGEQPGGRVAKAYAPKLQFGYENEAYEHTGNHLGHAREH